MDPCVSDNFERKMIAEIKKIETDRFDEGIKIGHDPRDDEDYDTKWIIIHSKEFAIKWDASLCKTCTCAKICGFKTTTKCKYYTPVEKKFDISFS